jgi:hypothetical protein
LKYCTLQHKEWTRPDRKTLTLKEKLNMAVEIRKP